MKTEQPENLMDGLFYEMNRCRDLLNEYKAIGPVGLFGHAMIAADLRAAENAIRENDVVKMLQAYNALKECQ